MTDEKHAFIEDVKNRKEMARGSFHKKSGAKSKKCNFPSDYLTKKELKELSSKSYSMSEFYSLEEFKQMPSRIQIEYIKSISEKYHVGLHAISKYLFDMSEKYLEQYAAHHNMKFITNAVRGGKASFYNAEFAKIVKESHKEQTPVEMDETLKSEPVIEKTESDDTLLITVDHVELVMKNGLDYMLLDQIYQRFDGRCVFKITIDKEN